MTDQRSYKAGLEAGMAIRTGWMRGSLSEDDVMDLGLRAIADVLNEDLPSPTRLRAGEWLLGYGRGLQVKAA